MMEERNEENVETKRQRDKETERKRRRKGESGQERERERERKCLYARQPQQSEKKYHGFHFIFN